MEQQKSFWRKFNPTLKDMTEKNSNLSVLGIWWAWKWRLAVIVIFVAIVFFILAGITGALFFGIVSHR